MIKWNLGTIIEIYGIKKTELAKNCNMSNGAITNLIKENKNTMPRIDGNRLNDLICGLNICLQKMNNPTTVKLHDLIEWIPDIE